jgi:limonene 1,2-monooxygenase
MRFGAFIAPFHKLNDNPTLMLERDMELVQHLDKLDFDEAWIGEHHSAGFETIGCPEIFIAAAAERTKHIRFGTGVSSLSYHHPFVLADRMAQLDHQTRGRVMLGVGPGQLPSDAFMMGIHPTEQREQLAASLECIVGLLDGKTVSKDTKWFKLVNGRLQILPYQSPRLEVAVACAVTPHGPMMAGKHGISMLSVAASSGPGFAALPDHWKICEKSAAEHGHKVHRDSWRVVVPIHIAETREQALAEVEAGAMDNIADYLLTVGGKPMQEAFGGAATGKEVMKVWTTKGINTFGVISVGTPDDIIARIEQMLEQSGGFGTFLIMAHNAANWEATKRSWEMFARYVMPHFKHSDKRRESSQYAAQNNVEFIGAAVKGTLDTIEKYKDKMSS